MKYIYSVLVLLLALFLAAFIQQNGSAIQLKYFYWSTPYLPLSLYMILSFAAGYALAVLVGFASGERFRLRALGAERAVRQLGKENRFPPGKGMRTALLEVTSTLTCPRS